MCMCMRIVLARPCMLSALYYSSLCLFHQEVCLCDRRGKCRATSHVVSENYVPVQASRAQTASYCLQIGGSLQFLARPTDSRLITLISSIPIDSSLHGAPGELHPADELGQRVGNAAGGLRIRAAQVPHDVLQQGRDRRQRALEDVPAGPRVRARALTPAARVGWRACLSGQTTGCKSLAWRVAKASEHGVAKASEHGNASASFGS